MTESDCEIAKVCGAVSAFIITGFGFLFQYLMLEMSVKYDNLTLQFLSVLIPVCMSKIWFESYEEALRDRGFQ